MNPTGGPDAPRVTWRRTAVAGVVIAAALVARSVVPRAPDAISRPATRSGGATSGDVDRPGVAPAPGAADRSSDAPAPAARSSRRRRPHAERRRERVDRRQRGDARAVFSTDP